MSEHVRRIGQLSMPDKEPYYRLIEEINFYYVVEYCGEIKCLPKDQYEKAQP